MSTRLNKADLVLIGAFLAFLAALRLKIIFPNEMTAALLFIAEASLVGGIADWFAVTALFKKPLGFPYHTAILPNRRAEFTAAVVKLITEDVLSPRRLVKKAAAPAFKNSLAVYLDNPAVTRAVTGVIEKSLAAKISGVDLNLPQEAAAAKIRAALNQFSAADAVACLKNFLADKNGQTLLTAAAQYAKNFTAAPGFERDAANYLRSLVEKPELKSIVAMVSRFLDFKMIADYDEAAHLIKLRLNALCEEIGTDTPTQTKLLARLLDAVGDLAVDEDFIGDFTEIKADIINSLSVEAVLAEILQNSRSEITDSGMVKNFAAGLAENFCNNLKDSTATDAFLTSVVKRAALLGRSIAAVTAAAAIGKLDDDDLNAVVYGKVEPDLLWIRMNGSIVGAAIGAVLFIVFELLPRYVVF